MPIYIKFLLTHPSRGATNHIQQKKFLFLFLLTHPSRGATISNYLANYKQKFLLTHPSRGATEMNRYYSGSSGFLLTHPSRGATEKGIKKFCMQLISTHTPLTGCNKRYNLNNYGSKISTHTPLTGCNCKIMYFTANCTPYNVGVDFFKNLY